MGELTHDREAAIMALACQLDVPEEVLRIPPLFTPQEHVEREAAFLREVDAAYVEAIRVLAPQFIAEAGLDPERYELIYESEGDRNG